MPALNIPNLTRIHPLIILPGIGVASYFAVGFFLGPATAAKTPQQVAADPPVSGRSSARTSDGIPDQIPKTLWSSPAAAAVTPAAPVAVMGGSGGAAPGAGSSGASTAASSGHSHEANTGHMPPPHVLVTPHNFYHPAAPPAPHVMQHAAPAPQMTQHFAPAPAPVYRPAPVPFFGGLFRGLGGGGHIGGGFSGGGHHR